MGVPGAKSYHLLFNGYGNIANLATKTANPYFVRMAFKHNGHYVRRCYGTKPNIFYTYQKLVVMMF